MLAAVGFLPQELTDDMGIIEHLQSISKSPFAPSQIKLFSGFLLPRKSSYVRFVITTDVSLSIGGGL
jgi:hypothetical protein